MRLFFWQSPDEQGFCATANQYDRYMKNVSFLLTCLPSINSVPLFENHVLCSHGVRVVGLMSFLFPFFILFAASSHTASVASLCHWDNLSVVPRPGDVPLTAWTFKCCIVDGLAAEVRSHLLLTDADEAPSKLRRQRAFTIKVSVSRQMNRVLLPWAGKETKTCKRNVLRLHVR